MLQETPNEWRIDLCNCCETQGSRAKSARRCATICAVCWFCTEPFVMARIASRIRHYPLAAGFISFLVVGCALVWGGIVLDLLGQIFYTMSLHVGYQTRLRTGESVDWTLYYVGIFFASISGVMLTAWFCVSCSIRGALRRRREIPGSECEDCLVVACCPCCSTVQMAHETDIEEFGSSLEVEELTELPIQELGG